VNPLVAVRALSAYRGLMAGLRLAPEDLEELRLERLRALVRHAYESVAYYRRAFDRAGVRPEDIRSVADLALLPLTSKDDLRHLPPGDIVSSRVPRRRLLSYTTSGSTGKPFVYYRTIETQLVHIMGRYRSMAVNGLRWRDRLLYICHVFHFAGTLPQRLGLLPTRVVSSLAPIENQLDALRSFRPTAVLVWPSAARALSVAMLERGVVLPSVRLAFTVSEMLDAPTARLIQQAFGVAPLSLYGCLEVARIGWQCRPGGPFHLGDDVLIAEVVRDGVPVPEGEAGELVVTSLVGGEMPLIRYRVGDLARRVARSCGCRHGFSQIELAGGRVSELLVLPDGSVRAPLEITAYLHQQAGIEQFQLRQERLDRVVIRIVAGRGYAEDTPQRLQREIGPILPGVTIQVERVPEIPSTPIGKHVYVVVAPEVRERQPSLALY
jgi:phenylacetate-CoA ligase